MPNEFIDEFFALYNTATTQTDFVVPLDAISKWLNCNKYNLMRTIRKNYKEGIDFTCTRDTVTLRKDPRHNNYKTCLLTPDCFKRIAMVSHSRNAEMVRSYFIDIESMFIKYREQTINGMRQDIEQLEANQKPKGNFEPKVGYLYIIKAADQKDGLYKIGRSKDLLARLRNYNSGKANDVDVLFTYRANDIVGAEGCVKSYLKKYQYRKYKEVFETNLNMIKELTRSCAEVGAKMIQKQGKTKMAGGYYIVIDSNPNTV